MICDVEIKLNNGKTVWYKYLTEEMVDALLSCINPYVINEFNVYYNMDGGIRE